MYCISHGIIHSTQIGHFRSFSVWEKTHNFQGAVCLISTGGYTRTTRIGKFELDEGSQLCHPPFRHYYYYYYYYTYTYTCDYYYHHIYYSTSLSLSLYIYIYHYYYYYIIIITIHTYS